MTSLAAVSTAILRRLEQLDADDEVVATQKVIAKGWKPDCLEPEKWRKDHATGYMVKSLHDAYMYELQHFCDELEQFDA